GAQQSATTPNRAGSSNRVSSLPRPPPLSGGIGAWPAGGLFQQQHRDAVADGETAAAGGAGQKIRFRLSRTSRLQRRVLRARAGQDLQQLRFQVNGHSSSQLARSLHPG